MSTLLSRIKRGNSELPNRILLAGPEGIGKSTFASKAPSPIFICSEDGLTGLEHVQRFVPESVPDLHSFLDDLLLDQNGFKNVVTDTVDWMERLIHRHLCKIHDATGIEDVMKGFGKGYTAAEEELVKILAKLDQLRLKGVGSIQLSHVHIRPFNDPAGESWDRYEMKGNKKFTGVLREWNDACLFAVSEVFKTKSKGERRERTIDGGRVMKTVWNPAYDAKNRLNLPESIPFDMDAWANLTAAITENSTTTLKARVTSLFATAKMDEAKKVQWAKPIAGLDSMTVDRLKAAIEKLEAMQ